jgi:hypothetical protein
MPRTAWSLSVFGFEEDRRGKQHCGGFGCTDKENGTTTNHEDFPWWGEGKQGKVKTEDGNGISAVCE